ncbi:unnamed protein product [Ilex paraguariensis]|uniref:non-specific serine/threonine protein kinase n=1 Tax=Ilex paraguariensis TaxID=185542 RepID=A0ABC8TQJ9_9AQUA
MFPPKSEASTRPRGLGNASEKVIVAVKAEKVISKTALAWALTHVVHPGDCITLLAVFSDEESSGRKKWRFPRFTGDCRDGDRKKLSDRICQVSESCSEMVLQFQDQIEVMVRIKVVSGLSTGAVAAEAKGNAANWVILDKKLKREHKHCMQELRCNIVVMKGSHPKVHRLNLGCPNEPQTPFFSSASSPISESAKLQFHGMKHSTPISSPEEPTTSYTRPSGEISSCSPDTGTSPFLVYEQNPLFEGLNKGKYMPISKWNNLDDLFIAMDLDREKIITLSTSPKTTNHKRVFWIPQFHIVDEEAPATRNTPKTESPATRTALESIMLSNQIISPGRDYHFNSSIREAVSLGRSSSVSPPLCSICQHKAPVFGKPPRRFHFKELAEATDGFSETTFLAEGQFGLVHRGVLRDGLVVAVKQLNFAGSQGDADFCREVRVLCCAQHRNVVLLIGFCIEGKKRVLVYEYICNGSLDFHLHGQNRAPLDWYSRLKVAIGTARGLRYLHEDCRVGCIVHRDMHTNNILLTHDFEPLVADFGLARLHREWDPSDEVQVAGSLGCLAPEHYNGGKITEKADIYAFGLVLLELITGQKASNLKCHKGRGFFSSNFFPLSVLEPIHLLLHEHELLDPCLAPHQLHNLPHELQAMGRAASLCLQEDPNSRPPMSKVLRMLEGGDAFIPLALDLNSIGSRSGHMQGLSSKTQPNSSRHSRKLSH